MSDEPKNIYYHDPFHSDHQHDTTGSNMHTTHKPPSIAEASSSSLYNLPPFDPSYTSFADCFQESMDYNSLPESYGFSPSPTEVFPSLDQGNQNPMNIGEDHITAGSSEHLQASAPNSPVSSSSADQDSSKSTKDMRPKEFMEDGEISKKVPNKSKKTGEKRHTEPRFAFMTKSEVDQLEDGYRWRKYGQKAVKNSPHPRSYYRCTTQNCTVKKRVERSFQDPSMVITTYEGQHNHPIPATLRGKAGAGEMYTSSVLTPTVMAPAPSFPPAEFYQIPEHGLLQDIVPSMFFEQYP